jgi:hypothetical protein
MKIFFYIRTESEQRMENLILCKLALFSYLAVEYLMIES